jgi:hypothetical protein
MENIMGLFTALSKRRDEAIVSLRAVQADTIRQYYVGVLDTCEEALIYLALSYNLKLDWKETP